VAFLLGTKRSEARGSPNPRAGRSLRSRQVEVKGRGAFSSQEGTPTPLASCKISAFRKAFLG